MSKERGARKGLLFLLAGALVALLIGWYTLFANSATDASNTISYNTSNNATNLQANKNNTNENFQEIYITALSNGEYDKSEITVKKGVPVRLHFTAEAGAAMAFSSVSVVSNSLLMRRYKKPKF